jgi:IS66 C-terminal element
MLVASWGVGWQGQHRQRQEGRQRMTEPTWLELECQRVVPGGAVPIDNYLEQQIKPWKLGAKDWLFAGGELAGQRAAVVMSLVQSAELNKLAPWAYLCDVLGRINSHPNSRIDERLPYRWQPTTD